jgi:hypothetical protein
MAASATVEKRRENNEGREFGTGKWEKGQGGEPFQSDTAWCSQMFPHRKPFRAQDGPTNRDEQDWTEVTPAQAFARD